jgi:eukaryotic-like serine/threonine-protein kinase
MAMNPAEHLTGKTVNNRWVVDKKVNLDENGSTGGFFSVAYEVRDAQTGVRAFLKILDVIKALQGYSAVGADVAEILNRVSSAHIFEVNLFKACGDKKLDRIVRALDHGDISLPIPPLGDMRFPFLVFELADGDTHKIRRAVANLDLAWWLRTLHQVATGLHQLHSIRAAHQDLKPSNVVFFGAENAKLTDLGRAVCQDLPSRNDSRQCAGDISHAPPEKVYQHVAADWEEKHLATDLYHLGSLIYSYFMNTSITTAIIHKLPPDLWPPPFNRFIGKPGYGGSFDNALPALEFAFAKVIQDFRQVIPNELEQQLLEALVQLCHPDPRKRGHPADHAMAHIPRYSVQRYVSAFNRMAVIAEGLIAT